MLPRLSSSAQLRCGLEPSGSNLELHPSGCAPYSYADPFPVPARLIFERLCGIRPSHPEVGPSSTDRWMCLSPDVGVQCLSL